MKEIRWLSFDIRYSMFDIRYCLLPFFQGGKELRIFLSGSLAAGDELFKEKFLSAGRGLDYFFPPTAPIATSLVIGSQ